MATLERKKKPKTETITQDEEDNEQIVEKEQLNDLTNDSILESLSKEPMEYNTCLSPEVVTSLQSVKHTSLHVLDLLLLQMVQELPLRSHRRLSDTEENLLGSITQNTNLLQSTGMMRSKSSPPATTISDVYRILDASAVNNYDYTLCCSLAALLNDVYRLLELNSITATTAEIISDESDDVTILHQQLHDQVSNFQRKRAEGIMTMDESDASAEMMMIWDEMDHLMNIIVSSNPPAYDVMPPPAYDTIETKKQPIINDKKKPNDLDSLMNAIDRLSHVAPRLNNQRVDLTERQLKELAAATLGRTVERLSRGRMENQRSPLPLKTRGQVLQHLVTQIQKSASRSLDNQRVNLEQIQHRRDIATMDGLLDRLDKGRLVDQDWISREEVLIHDLQHTTNLLIKSLNRPAYTRQRFSMSDAKERFMTGLFTKVESLEGYRLVNQDAELKEPLEENEDLHQLLEHIYNSKPQLDNQRASFTL